MLLSGSIRTFKLASVLQFLAHEQATGIIEVRDFDEFGFIYLIEGRVQAISLPMTDEKLGTRLVKAGLLDEAQLSEVLMADTLLSKEEKKAKPLGQRLLDKGYITADQVRDIMVRQTLDQIFALSHWQNGVFEFDESETMPEFTIRIAGNVQELLLDAYRRIDEGERMKVSKTVIDNEVCYGCPVVAECNSEIKERFLKRDVCLWRRMGAIIDDDYEKVQDSQRLYKSRDAIEKPTLETALGTDGGIDLGDA
jgi:hypothetical protein